MSDAKIFFSSCAVIPSENSAVDKQSIKLKKNSNRVVRVPGIPLKNQTKQSKSKQNTKKKKIPLNFQSPM